MSDTRQPEPNMQSAVERMMPSIASELEDAQKGRVRCIVVTPEKAVLDEIAEMVILPMIDGELGVLHGRAPIIGRLGAGELRLKSNGNVKPLLHRSRVRAGALEHRDGTHRERAPGDRDHLRNGDRRRDEGRVASRDQRR